MLIIERIYQFIDNLKLSVREFERSVDIKNGYFAKMKAASGSVGGELLSKIVLTYPQLNATWLLTGEGKMIVKKGNLVEEEQAKQTNEVKQLKDTINNLNAYIEKMKLVTEHYGEHIPPIVDAKLNVLLEALAEVGSGKRYRSKDEAIAALGKSFYLDLKK